MQNRVPKTENETTLAMECVPSLGLVFVNLLHARSKKFAFFNAKPRSKTENETALAMELGGSPARIMEVIKGDTWDTR